MRISGFGCVIFVVWLLSITSLDAASSHDCDNRLEQLRANTRRTDWVKAIRDLEKHCDEHVPSLIALGAYYSRLAILAERIEKSFKLLSKAVRLEPEKVEAHTALGTAWQSLGYYSRAASHFRDAESIQQDSASLARVRALRTTNEFMSALVRDTSDVAISGLKEKDAVKKIDTLFANISPRCGWDKLGSLVAAVCKAAGWTLKDAEARPLCLVLEHVYNCRTKTLPILVDTLNTKLAAALSTLSTIVGEHGLARSVDSICESYGYDPLQWPPPGFAEEWEYWFRIEPRDTLRSFMIGDSLRIVEKWNNPNIRGVWF